MHKPLLLQDIQAVIIRQPEQSQELVQKLVLLGAEVSTYPVMEIASLPLPSCLAESKNPFETYHCVVWTSQNAVTYFFSQLTAKQREQIIRSKRPIFACVGKKTSERLKKYGFDTDLMPSKATALELAQALQHAYPIDGWNILFPCSKQARLALPEQLSKARANVDQFAIYEPRPTNPDPRELWTFFQQQKIVLLLFASPSAVRYFVENVGHEKLQKNIDALCFASIGKTTAGALQKRELPSHIVPDSPGISSLLSAIQDYFENRLNNHPQKNQKDK